MKVSLADVNGESRLRKYLVNEVNLASLCQVLLYLWIFLLLEINSKGVPAIFLGPMRVQTLIKTKITGASQSFEAESPITH